MLVFTAQIKDDRSGRRASRHAGHIIETLLVGPSEVVDDRLAKMIAVGQRLPGDAGHAGVNRFSLGAQVAAAVFEKGALTGKFQVQGAVDTASFAFLLSLSLGRRRGRSRPCG